MKNIIMFAIFVFAGIICDIINIQSTRKKPVITAYCLLTVCALAIIIGAGSGHPPPGATDIVEMILYRKE